MPANDLLVEKVLVACETVCVAVRQLLLWKRHSEHSRNFNRNCQANAGRIDRGPKSAAPNVALWIGCRVPTLNDFH